MGGGTHKESLPGQGRCVEARSSQWRAKQPRQPALVPPLVAQLAKQGADTRPRPSILPPSTHTRAPATTPTPTPNPPISTNHPRSAPPPVPTPLSQRTNVVQQRAQQVQGGLQERLHIVLVRICQHRKHLRVGRNTRPAVRDGAAGRHMPPACPRVGTDPCEQTLSCLLPGAATRSCMTHCGALAHAPRLPVQPTHTQPLYLTGWQRGRPTRPAVDGCAQMCPAARHSASSRQAAATRPATHPVHRLQLHQRRGRQHLGIRHQPAQAHVVHVVVGVRYGQPLKEAAGWEWGR